MLSYIECILIVCVHLLSGLPMTYLYKSLGDSLSRISHLFRYRFGSRFYLSFGGDFA